MFSCEICKKFLEQLFQRTSLDGWISIISYTVMFKYVSICIKNWLRGMWEWNCDACALECKIWARAIAQWAGGKKELQRMKEDGRLYSRPMSESYVSESNLLFLVIFFFCIPFFCGNCLETIMFEGKMLWKRVIVSNI